MTGDGMTEALDIIAKHRRGATTVTRADCSCGRTTHARLEAENTRKGVYHWQSYRWAEGGTSWPRPVEGPVCMDCGHAINLEALTDG